MPDYGSWKHRILIIDDNAAIHEDFRKIFSFEQEDTSALDEIEAGLFGGHVESVARPDFAIDSAYQGEAGIARVKQALKEGEPYSLVFVDVRMPPGIDGVETSARILECDQETQIVICTAYSDYSWSQICHRLGRSDRFVILKKPFDNMEVLQLANALTRKWQLTRHATAQVRSLQRALEERGRELESLKLEQAETTSPDEAAPDTATPRV